MSSIRSLLPSPHRRTTRREDDAVSLRCRGTYTAVNVTMVGGEPIVRGEGERAALVALLAALVAAVEAGTVAT